MKTRSSGLLLHITSLPGNFPLGDLGPQAYSFADFLQRSGQGYWQLLPLNPTNGISQHSPYSSDSAFAGNPLLISPELLQRSGLLATQEIPAFTIQDYCRADYGQTEQLKQQILSCACQRLTEKDQLYLEYQLFCRQQQNWLQDYALFKVLKNRHNQLPWTQWPREFKDRHSQALEAAARDYAPELARVKQEQFLFFKQWQALKSYCNLQGIKLIGDLPIYVSQDSADVWAHRDLFLLNSDGTPSSLAGVPPDYFSNTGQLWGNPLYDWHQLQNQNFFWWLHRMGQAFDLYDVVRIDHFRGLVGYWEIPAGEETAENGAWRQAPAYAFLRTLFKHYPALPIIAEDLGEITADVREVMTHFSLPNMKVLLFAFDLDDPWHPFLPHNYSPNCVVYTGTHDTNTFLGWFEQEASAEAQQRLFAYLGRSPARESLPWTIIQLSLMSVANLSITPVQDLLGLDHRARMNNPGQEDSNWTWRLAPDALQEELAHDLGRMTRIYGRT